MNLKKRDVIASLVAGEITSWFIIFIIKNPHIEELRGLASIEGLIWALPVVFPIIFFLGIVTAAILGRIARVFYQIIRFGEVGVLNTIMDFGILNLLIWLTGITSGLAIIPLNIFSFLTATVNSYFWNKSWTFEKQGGSTSKEFSQFLVISMIGLGINTAIIYMGTTLVSPLFGLSSGAWANIMKVFATMFSMVWNFFGYKFIVFKK